jgi:putative cell wall-binding protein
VAVAISLAIAVAMGLLPAGAAHALAPVVTAPPTPPVPLPPEVDLIDNYEGQILCDPTPKPGTLKLRDTLWRTYGSGIWAGISRDCNVSWDPGISEHKDGRAIDWGVNVRNGTKSIGDEFVAWATANNGANARRMGIMYMIWDSRMWRLYDMDRGWAEYRNCVSRYTSSSYDTTCHRDHIHISMTWHGAGAWTSWYDGSAVTEPACRAGDPIDVKPGRPDAPSRLFEPVPGIGVANGKPCYLGKSIQTLRVPTPDGQGVVQRLRISHSNTNAPSAVKLWTNAGSSLTLSRSARYPVEHFVTVAADGLIYVQSPVGQTDIRIDGLGQQPTWRVVRLAGSNRYATAVEVSRDGYAPGVATAYVASGENFPDALAAGPAGGPVLLVQPTAVPAAVDAELRRLAPGRIVIAGGTGAVSAAVERQLAGIAPVVRAAGPNRYTTAAAVSALSHPGGSPVAYLATGANYPDALAAGPAAARRDAPLLLTAGDRLIDEAATELARLGVRDVVIAGGTGVVAPAVESRLRQLGYTVTRAAGPDRYATATALSKQVFGAGSAGQVYLATGRNFPDALGAGAAAAGRGVPLLLSNTTCMPTTSRDEIRRTGAGTARVSGGTAVLSDPAAYGSIC